MVWRGGGVRRLGGWREERVVGDGPLLHRDGHLPNMGAPLLHRDGDAPREVERRLALGVTEVHRGDVALLLVDVPAILGKRTHTV